jgi:hypothetical protein
MGMTNAERQRQFTEKVLKDRKGTLRVRVQVLLTAQAARTLKGLRKATGKTQAEVIEEALKPLQCTPRKAKGK